MSTLGAVAFEADTFAWRVKDEAAIGMLYSLALLTFIRTEVGP